MDTRVAFDGLPVEVVVTGRGGAGAGLRARWDWIEERIAEVVLVKTWRASGGGLFD